MGYRTNVCRSVNILSRLFFIEKGQNSSGPCCFYLPIYVICSKNFHKRNCICTVILNVRNECQIFLYCFIMHFVVNYVFYFIAHFFYFLCCLFRLFLFPTFPSATTGYFLHTPRVFF